MMVVYVKVVEKYKKVEYLGEIGIVYILELKYGIINYFEDICFVRKEYILVN